MHTTEEHKTKEEMQAESTSTGHHAAMDYQENEENGELQMMGSLAGSLFLCEEAVQVFDDGKANFNGTPGEKPHQDVRAQSAQY
jgi:hypothetical protein